MIKVTNLATVVYRKGSISGVRKLNMKSLSLIVQKLWLMVQMKNNDQNLGHKVSDFNTLSSIQRTSISRACIQNNLSLSLKVQVVVKDRVEKHRSKSRLKGHWPWHFVVYKEGLISRVSIPNMRCLSLVDQKLWIRLKLCTIGQGGILLTHQEAISR